MDITPVSQNSIPSSVPSSGNPDWGFRLPSLPQLPNLSSGLPPIGPNTAAPFGDIIVRAIGGLGGIFTGEGIQGGADSASGFVTGAKSTAAFLTDPVRIVTVTVGLLFLFGGLYILGTSSIADAVARVAK